ncbi:MAG: thiamine pyrophosphate-binding protein [Gammaproteobacteria bacterium]|nr:thiamine pyrophosphate-binding protein [Gammaproteobacteria bacterium]
MSAALTGGMVVSRALARYGVRTVFAVAGASHSFLLDALERDGFEIISSRHESGCVGAADGYARITGKPGVALIIADQGTPNAINGIATAFHACSPVLVLIARLPNSWTEAEAEYDSAKHPLVDSITKWARTVPAPERLAEYVDVAAKRALSGRRGPVVLQIPQEYLQATLADAGAANLPAPRTTRAVADPAAIATAAELLATARRPLLIVGAGACQGDAGASLRTLVEEFDLPIAGNGLGRGLVAEDWVRSFNWPVMQIAAKDADVVCVIGARLKQRLGYGLPPRFSADAKFVQIDIEAEELSRNRRIDVAIVADAGRACEQLLAALRARRTTGAAPSPRAFWVRDALRARFDYLDSLVRTPLPNDTIHPLVLGRAIAQLAPADTIFVGDGADIQTWMYGALQVRQAPGFLDHYPMGAMGTGTPLAVGAAAAARELSTKKSRCVVLTTGDGSFGFYPAELHAAARAGLKIVCIIGNDGVWGTEWHGQMKALSRPVNTELGYLDYEKVAEGFGCRGERVTRRSELEAALQRAFAHDGPSVLNVIIDRDAGAAIKSNPLAQMILFDDLATNLKAQHAFAG